MYAASIASETTKTDWAFINEKRMTPNKLGVMIDYTSKNNHSSTWENKQGFTINISNSIIKRGFSDLESAIMVRKYRIDSTYKR
jgi:hypothetical protein